MELIFSLIILLSVVAVDSETNSSIGKNLNLRNLVSESGNDGNRSTRVSNLSSQAPSFRNYLVTPPSMIRDIKRGKRRYLTLRSNNTASEILSPLPNKTSSASKFKSISHLKLRKTDDSSIVIREKYEESSKTTGKFGILSHNNNNNNNNNNKRRGIREKRQETERFLYDSNLKNKIISDTRSSDYYPEVNVGNGDRYYYKDFASEGLSQMVQLSRQTPRTLEGYQEIGPKRFQTDSCRKYLEFLKYAFEQLDSPSMRLYSDDQDEYFYYDGDYNKADPKIANGYVTNSPPVIVPDMAVLHKMAVGNFKITPNEAEVVSVSGNDTKKRFSELPETNKSLTTSLPSSSPPLNLDILTLRTESIKNLASTTESQQQNLSESYNHWSPVSAISNFAVNNDSRISENCADKLFPCPDNVNVTYPVNGYCNRFVACIAGKPYPEFCPDGLHFNLIKKQCDLPHNSFCTYSCPAADGYFAIPGDCGGFFRCSNWYPEYRLCPPLMHWDNKAKICTFQELSSCPLKCDSPNQVKPYRGFRSAYVICTRNLPSYNECPDGSYFNEKQVRCKFEHLSNFTNDEDYMTKNRGIANGKETLCADVELKNGGKARWCQEIFKKI